MLEAIGVLEGEFEGGVMPRPPRPLLLLGTPLLRALLLRVVLRLDVALEAEAPLVARVVLVAAGNTSGVTALTAGAWGWAVLALASAGTAETFAAVAPAAAAAAGPGDAAEGLEGVAMAVGRKRGSRNVQNAGCALNHPAPRNR